jgi:hypothetical protein
MGALHGTYRTYMSHRSYAAVLPKRLSTRRKRLTRF